jgi:hypothetical protein
MFDAIGLERDIWNGGRKTQTALALVMLSAKKMVRTFRLREDSARSGTDEAVECQAGPFADRRKIVTGART